MMPALTSQETKQLLAFQTNEITEHHIYHQLSLLQKNENDLFVDEKNGNTIDLSLGRLYSSDGKYISISIKTKKEYMLDNNNKAIQIKCSWYEPNYTIYDTYIAEVVDFGSEDDKKDVNNKNLKFSNQGGFYYVR